jgi:hypothetical protein
MQNAAELSQVSGTSASREKTDLEARVVHVKFEPDIYDSVAVAAFGGVRIGVSSQGAVHAEPVHPFWMFLPACVLFVIQFSLIALLSLDFDLTQKVEETGKDQNGVNKSLLTMMKFLMSFIVQLQLFSEILSCLRLLIFVANPTTWIELKRPDPKDMTSRFAWTYKAVYVAPFAIVSLGLKLLMDYLVCVESLSIILSADSAAMVIFNSLAIVWIVDVDVVFYDVWNVLCQFDTDAFEDHTFEELPDDHEWRENVPQWYKMAQEKLKGLVGAYGFGCKPSTIAKNATYLLIMLMYFRQLQILQFAIDTGVIPVARDVCAYWRVLDGPNHAELATLADDGLKDFSFLTVFKVLRTQLERIADPHRKHNKGYCTEKYNRMSTADQWGLMTTHPDLWWSLLGLIIIFFLPQVIIYAGVAVGKWTKRSNSNLQGKERQQILLAKHNNRLAKVEEQHQERHVHYQQLFQSHHDNNASVTERLRQLEMYGEQTQSHTVMLETKLFGAFQEQFQRLETDMERRIEACVGDVAQLQTRLFGQVQERMTRLEAEVPRMVEACTGDISVGGDASMLIAPLQKRLQKLETDFQKLETDKAYTGDISLGGDVSMLITPLQKRLQKLEADTPKLIEACLSDIALLEGNLQKLQADTPKLVEAFVGDPAIAELKLAGQIEERMSQIKLELPGMVEACNARNPGQTSGAAKVDPALLERIERFELALPKIQKELGLRVSEGDVQSTLEGMVPRMVEASVESHLLRTFQERVKMMESDMYTLKEEVKTDRLQFEAQLNTKLQEQPKERKDGGGFQDSEQPEASMLRQEMLEMKAMLEIVQRQTVQPSIQSLDNKVAPVSPRTVSEASEHTLDPMSPDKPTNFSGLPDIQTMVNNMKDEVKTIMTGEARPGVTIPSSMVSPLNFPRSETHQVMPPPPTLTMPPWQPPPTLTMPAVEVPAGPGGASMVPRPRERAPPQYIPSATPLSPLTPLSASAVAAQQAMNRDGLSSSLKPASAIGGGTANRIPTTVSPTRIVAGTAVMPQPARSAISPRAVPQLPSNIVVHHGDITTTTRHPQSRQAQQPSRSDELLHQLPARHSRPGWLGFDRS